LPVPVVVIGGMTPENAAPLVSEGADMVAAISSVYMAGDPQAAALRFADLFGG
jgi:thiamine-phosphate pyrophosphorylase